MKKRIMAIIGIVLPIICLFPLMTVKDPEIGSFVPIFVLTGTEPYNGAIVNKIWIQSLITLCILLLFQLFCYGTSLITGIKEKIKTLSVFSVIGIIISICLFLTFLSADFCTNSTDWYAVMLVMNMPYLIIFSIVMLIRSFKKKKTEAEITHSA